MNNEMNRRGLFLYEAGWLLEKSVGEVRGMLAHGELVRESDGRIDAESVRRLFDEDDIGRSLVDWVAAGLILPPHPEPAHARPESWRGDLWRGLMLGAMFGPILGRP